MQCEPCEIEMNERIIAIKIGDNWTDPQNPCLVYRCIVSLHMQLCSIQLVIGKCCKLHCRVQAKSNGLRNSALPQKKSVLMENHPITFLGYAVHRVVSGHCHIVVLHLTISLSFSPAAYTNPVVLGTQEFRLNTSTRNPEPVDSWGEWTEWTRCSRECGTGRQSRMRECQFENKARIECSGDRVQLQECNTQPCPGEGACLH